MGEAVGTVTYGYDDDNWGDLLTSYNGKTITYDAIGNPLNDGTWAYIWEHGRQLASMNSEKTTLEFEYNADGIRTKKTVTTTSDHVHSFQDTVHQPKCTENGYTTHTCICGYIYQDSPVPATGHSYTASVVADTCTANSYTLYSCICGDSYQEGAKGHTFTTLVVEPTETVNGFTLHQCECGYSYESDPVASLAGASDTVDVISDTKVYDYVYNGSTLTQLTITTTITGDGTSTEELYFAYDGSSPMSVTYNGDTFYYVTNLQGDVIALLDENGAAAVTYSYDAWGNILSIDGSMKDDLGAVNPLTYRGYIYDDDSELYYLQSRYYNPQIGRFLNVDSIIATGGLLGNNAFSYCNNTPVNGCDPCGTCLHRWDFWNDCEKCGGETLGEKWEAYTEGVHDYYASQAEMQQQEAQYQLGIARNICDKIASGASWIAQKETQRRQAENEFVWNCITSVYDAYMRGYNIEQQSQMMEAQGKFDCLSTPELRDKTLKCIGAELGLIAAIQGGNALGIISAGIAFFYVIQDLCEE